MNIDPSKDVYSFSTQLCYLGYLWNEDCSWIASGISGLETSSLDSEVHSDWIPSCLVETSETDEDVSISSSGHGM